MASQGNFLSTSGVLPDFSDDEMDYDDSGVSDDEDNFPLTHFQTGGANRALDDADLESPDDADVALPLRASSPDIINHPSPRQRSDSPEPSPPPAQLPRLEQRGINPNCEGQNANNRIDIQVGGIRDFTWDSVADLAKPTYAEGTSTSSKRKPFGAHFTISGNSLVMTFWTLL